MTKCTDFIMNNINKLSPRDIAISLWCFGKMNYPSIEVKTAMSLKVKQIV